MFGEILILGSADLKRDPKNRIFVPSWTKVETADNLVLVKSITNENSLEIYGQSQFEELTKKFDRKLESAQTLDEYIVIKKEIEEYYSNYVLKTEQTDKQHRITVPAEVKLGTKIKAIGCKNYLLLKTIK